MKIHRTIPPAAAPIGVRSLAHGLAGMFFGARYLEKLERELRKYFGVPHVFLVSSGKAALTVILQALHSLAPDKREVIIPAYTCFSVPSAVVRAGLDVRLCDVRLDKYDFDYACLGKAVNERTLCIIPNHLFGAPADMERLTSLCRDHGVFLIEDAAQSMGGTYRGKLLGTIGDVGFFSLGRGKNITCGSGGIIITGSHAIASAVRSIYRRIDTPRLGEAVTEWIKAVVLAIFVHPALFWLPTGIPFLRLGETIFYADFPIKRLSGAGAGMMNRWQERLEHDNRIRRESVNYYHRTMHPGLQWRYFDGEASLRLPLLAENREMRDLLYSGLQGRGVGASTMYPSPINEIGELRGHFDGASYPAAQALSERLLTIPTHPLLSAKDKEKICALFSDLAESFQDTKYYSMNRSGTHTAERI